MNARALLTWPPFLFLLIFLCLFPLVSPLYAEGNDQADVLSGWGKMKEAFDRFAKEPSSITAREFYNSIPPDEEPARDRKEILDHIILRDGIIATEMLQGNTYAARAAIRILKFVKGSSQQRVGGRLGELIRVKPAVFLKACYEEREDPYIKGKGFPVGYIPYIMKKKERSSYELEIRMEALRSVEDLELESVRDECLKGLKDEIEELGLEIPSCAGYEERPFDDQKEKIASVFEEMLRIPCPENMKRVLALISDDRKYIYDNIIPFIFPILKSGRMIVDPYEVIIHEAECANEYAIDVLFRTSFYIIGLESMQFCALISNLILINPPLFIEKLAENRHSLGSVISSDDLDYICNYVSDWDYSEETDGDVILRRRIDALASLNIPEHQELINHCIKLITTQLKKMI